MSHLLIESYSIENLNPFLERVISYECHSIITLILFFESSLACNVCATLFGTLLAIASSMPDSYKQVLCQTKSVVLASFVL